MTVISEMCGVH